MIVSKKMRTFENNFLTISSSQSKSPNVNTKALLKGVEQLHADAVKSAGLTVEGEKYTFAFNGRNYEVAGPDGAHLVTFNTRKISDARKWMRDWLAN